MKLMKRWLIREQGADQVVEKIAVEQFLNVTGGLHLKTQVHQVELHLPAQKYKNELFIPCCGPYLALSSGACGASIRASVPEL